MSVAYGPSLGAGLWHPPGGEPVRQINAAAVFIGTRHIGCLRKLDYPPEFVEGDGIEHPACQLYMFEPITTQLPAMACMDRRTLHEHLGALARQLSSC